MSNASNAILQTLLDRLYASLVSGPCLASRPHTSRQRIDLAALAALKHRDPGAIMPELLDGSGRCEVQAKVPLWRGGEFEEAEVTPGEREARRAWQAQERVLNKLRDMAEDARDYEQDTGENALYIGYPVLHVPPGSELTKGSSQRVLAPVALIPVDLAVQRGARRSVAIQAKGRGSDRVIANFPLLAWLEQQTGQDTSDLFQDEEGSDPWREINELARVLAEGLRIPVVPHFGPRTGEQSGPLGPLDAIPRTEELGDEPGFLNAAVLGLFPVSNQGLLRDLKAMMRMESLSPTVQPFLEAKGSSRLAMPADSARVEIPPERLIAPADPCQARAVRLALTAPLLVVHGPPGTGKSQTITNLIGDHLARGQRVLFVCEKRTAMDVVCNRLSHLGLGGLCAIVHDPQRDQRDLYMGVREQLDGLTERRTDATAEATAEARLNQIDAELKKLHAELTGFREAIAGPDANGCGTFHSLVAEWLEIPATDLDLTSEALGEAALENYAAASSALAETLERAEEIGFLKSLWNSAAGLDLARFLSQPAREWEKTLGGLEVLARSLDETRDEASPQLQADDLAGQARARKRLAELVEETDGLNLPETRTRLAAGTAESVRTVLESLDSTAAHRGRIGSSPLNADWRTIALSEDATLAKANQNLAALSDFDEASAKWYGFLLSGKKKPAEDLARRFGISPREGGSQRLREFFEGLKDRLLCQAKLTELFGLRFSSLPADEELIRLWEQHRALVKAMLEAKQLAGAELEAFLRKAWTGASAQTIAALRRSADRAERIQKLAAACGRAELFESTWLQRQIEIWCAHGLAAETFALLRAELGELEGVLRLQQARAQVPPKFLPVIDSLLAAGLGRERGAAALRKALIEKELFWRIRENTFLQQVDAPRVEKLFGQHRELENKKRDAVRESILHLWVSRQKQRLLSNAGNQLNSAGAALKRRLLTRGERALKLRPMIAQGASQPEGDPLFDICPVWMASPGTVARIFPREPLFDLIVFDEASQCRLEEALPVLLRGQRVVVAGDPKQLPPTRFFEAAVVESEIEEAESEQGLFEQQQAESEDLLAAALNLEAFQTFLDVHYRSRHSGLIEFSNQNFYERRLQAIPGHPRNRADGSPIRLIRADGLYEKRTNATEARTVCTLVKELLESPSPPSIGIACFNLTQRDLILDELEALAEKDAAFAARLEAARNRTGAGSHEGLFVRNLENVQGDERDHIIISTTFGPDASGKFRRNFGPLGKEGGGRRLNVLVTRAREMVHVVTSLPRGEYAALPSAGSGQIRGGRWLLYSYLKYAEELETEAAPVAAAENTASAPGLAVHDVEHLSPVAAAVARRLFETQQLGSQAPWGNRGFCVDIAVRHPQAPEAISLGVLCDFAHYAPADDPVHWDIFRTSILEAQGWTMHRLLSPALFLDPEKSIRAIRDAATKVK